MTDPRGEARPASPAPTAEPGPTGARPGADHGRTEPAGGRTQGGRPPGGPTGRAGIGSIFTLAFLVILVPGIVVYLVTHALGLGLAPASLLGLLTVIVCLALFPGVLVKLGWVHRRPRRKSR